jgi:hypothetical protein
MAIKATFKDRENSTTVSGLYQWDYGQVLEIEAVDLPAIVEVHFACPNMKEAIVRSCSVVNGVGTVTIPDVCLEQSGTISAWVYAIEGTGGRTVKTITLPITARTRPNISQDIPVEVSSRYTELITEVNEAVGALQTGAVAVAFATNAEEASHANTAGNASSASHATFADRANGATHADWASRAAYTSILNQSSEPKDSVVLPRDFAVYAVVLIKNQNGSVSTITDLLVIDNPATSWESGHLIYDSSNLSITPKDSAYKIDVVIQLVCNK